MKKKKSGAVWMILPLYIFTIIFVAGPLLYMVALSFAQPKARTWSGVDLYSGKL